MFKQRKRHRPIEKHLTMMNGFVRAAGAEPSDRNLITLSSGSAAAASAKGDFYFL